MKRLIILVAAGLLSLGVSTASAQDEDAASMAELLELIQQGQSRDNAEARQREARFAQQRNQQQALLNQARAERTRLEGESARLEQLFEDNQGRIAVARANLDERLGALKELFGVLQTVSGDTQARFNSSLTSIHYPDRGDFLVELGNKMAGANTLASIDDIEQLWEELYREITESGKIVKFNSAVTTADGTVVDTDVVRVGLFNIASDAGYPKFNAETGTISELAKQPPQARYVNSASDIVSAGPNEIVTFGLDLTRGGILATLVDSPSVMDRIHQGGIVGYCIIALGFVGLLIAIWRFIGLSTDSRKVSAQLKRDTASTDNPLGRVLAAYESNKAADTETIELKLSEAALKEMPGLTKGLLFIKVISVVAPLMGLLGTVTGMIRTFQVITLYGAGDPKMMAGGISQALMTTVLGLVVAIPMVLLHTIVSGQSRKVINILQSQSAGLVAQHSEANH